MEDLFPARRIFLIRRIVEAEGSDEGVRKHSKNNLDACAEGQAVFAAPLSRMGATATWQSRGLMAG